MKANFVTVLAIVLATILAFSSVCAFGDGNISITRPYEPNYFLDGPLQPGDVPIIVPEDMYIESEEGARIPYPFFDKPDAAKSRDNELYIKISTEDDAMNLGEKYGLELKSYEKGVAMYITRMDLGSLVNAGIFEDAELDYAVTQIVYFSGDKQVTAELQINVEPIDQEPGNGAKNNADKSSGARQK